MIHLRYNHSTSTWCGKSIQYQAGWGGTRHLRTTSLPSAADCRCCLAAERKWKAAHAKVRAAQDAVNLWAAGTKGGEHGKV